MEKRGQITIFIILGIIILIALVTFFYIRSTAIERKLRPEIIPAITEIPSEVRPIRLFIQKNVFLQYQKRHLEKLEIKEGI